MAPDGKCLANIIDKGKHETGRTPPARDKYIKAHECSNLLKYEIEQDFIQVNVLPTRCLYTVQLLLKPSYDLRVRGVYAYLGSLSRYDAQSSAIHPGKNSTGTVQRLNKKRKKSEPENAEPLRKLRCELFKDIKSLNVKPKPKTSSLASSSEKQRRHISIRKNIFGEDTTGVNATSRRPPPPPPSSTAPRCLKGFVKTKEPRWCESPKTTNDSPLPKRLKVSKLHGSTRADAIEASRGNGITTNKVVKVLWKSKSYKEPD